jgi:hypothetical protein
MAYSLREEKRERERDSLIYLMKNAKPRTLHGLKVSVEKTKDKLKKNKVKLQKMSEEKFREMISRDIFGVAMKSFYTDKIDKQMESLDEISGRADFMVELRCEGSTASDYVEKEAFKGRMKEGLTLLDEFTPKICVCVKDYVKENKQKYLVRGSFTDKKQKQMLRDARRECKKDSDRDGVPDWKDCRPYDKTKQDEDEDTIMEAWSEIEKARKGDGRRPLPPVGEQWILEPGYTRVNGRIVKKQRLYE